MKTLSDYKDDEAIDLWATILDPLMVIVGDEEIKKMYAEKKSYASIAAVAIKEHKEQVKEVILAIDDTPITASNLMTRVLVNMLDMVNDGEYGAFLNSQVQKDGQSASTPATESTEVKEP